MTEIRALTADEWRRLRLARMAAVEAMPYFARALFALSPVAAPGLKTFAVDRYWRLYVDPTMLGTDEGWSIPLAGAVLLHEVGHVLRDHGGRADSVDSPVDRTMWNVAADAEINDDLIAAGVGPARWRGHPHRRSAARTATPPRSTTGIWCRPVRPATAHDTDPGDDGDGAGAAPVPGMRPCRGNCPPPPTWAAARVCPPPPPIW